MSFWQPFPYALATNHHHPMVRQSRAGVAEALNHGALNVPGICVREYGYQPFCGDLRQLGRQQVNAFG